VDIQISVTIITLNEEKYIKGCIDSVRELAEEIIVIDSGSTDNTCAIAAQAGAKVFVHPFENYGKQKNIASNYAKNNWILNLDADERLENQLIEEIRNLKFNDKRFEAYAFPRRNFIGTRWQKVWSPDCVVRLYNKALCNFSESVVHEAILTTRYMQLKAALLHYSFSDLSDCIIRADKYSRLDATLMLHRQKKISFRDPMLHGVVSFFKFFVLKKGFLYGIDGLNASVIGGLRSYLKYAYALEMQQNHKS
jgi:glycosyltransferase involved in cell wall biosynthesis